MIHFIREVLRTSCDMSKFKSKKIQVQFESFLENHLAHVLDCAQLAHFMVRARKRFCADESETAPAAMTIEVDHKYLQLVISYESNYAARMWEEKDHEELIRTICHEVAHLVTTEAESKLVFISNSKEKSYYFERMTEHTSRWLYGYYDRYWMKSRKIKIETGVSKYPNER